MDTPRPVVTISSLHFEWASLEEAFGRAIDELGLDGIEFSASPGASYPHLPEEEYEAAAKLGARHDAHLSGHVWGDLAQLGADGATQQLVEWLEVSRRAGFQQLIVHGGSHDDQAAGVRITRDALAAVAGRYEAAGVVICLENHYAYDYHDSHELFSTSEEFLEVLHAVNSPAVRFCLDYGHAHMNDNIGDLLRKAAPFLAYTHLADNMGSDDDRLAFGRGTLDWRSALELTRDVGYRGPFTVEFPVRRGDEGPLWDCLQMIQEVYDQAG